MPIESVDLSDDQGRFIAQEVKSGHYPDAAAVLRAGVRRLERERREYERKLAILRAAIDEGDASGDAEGDVFAEVRERIHQRALEKGAGK